MKTRRLQIEDKLDVLIHHKRTLDFQWLATHVARDKWPTLEATQWYSDAGEDATSYFTVDGVKRSLACSITATLGKIKDDARRIRDEKRVIDVLVFATPVVVTQIQIHDWQKEIDKEFKHDLHVIPRSEIVAFLEQPQNAWLCRDYLDLSFEDHPDQSAIALKARAGAARVLAAWKDDYKFERIRPIELGISVLRTDRNPKSECIGLADVCQIIKRSRRIVLQGAPGAGKSITLLQIADALLNETDGPIPIVMALTEWASDSRDLISFLAQKLSPEGLTAAELARLHAAGRLIFLLNGWNEISSDVAILAAERLKAAVRDSSATSFVIATRGRDKTPPFSEVVTLQIEPLTADQKHEILARSGAADQSTLVLRIGTDLADVTETPFFLAGVIQLANLGPDIPKSRYGIMRALVENAENAHDHREALLNGACRKFHREYLCRIAFAMMAKGAAAIPERDMLTPVAEFSRALHEKAWIAEVPDAHAVVENLVDHHLLARTPIAGGDVRFVHQQFQEWFAAEWLHERISELAGDAQSDKIFVFQRDVLNRFRWMQPLSFLLERLAEGAEEELRFAEKLIRWSMPVGLLLSAELAGIAGAPVWPFIRDDFSKSLRKWYARNSERQRTCALAAMLATRAPDFKDILWPLLESPDQQIRLRTYRTWHPFSLTSLGADWRKRFDKWDVQQKVEFIQEMGLQPGQEHIGLACELAKVEKNLEVRLACLRLLNDAGATETCAEIVNSLEFERWAKDLANELLPRLPKRCLRPLVPRLKTALAGLQSVEGRYEVIGALHSIGDPDSQELMKAEMDRILKTDCVVPLPSNDWLGPTSQKPTLPNATPILARYLEVVHRVSPGWAMDWLGDQLVHGRLWWEPFTDYLAKMPGPTLQKLATAALNADLDINTISSRARLLGRSGSSVAAKAILYQSLAWAEKNEVRRPGESFNRGDALKLGIHEVPLPVMVDVVIQESEGVEDFQRLRDLLDFVMPSAAMDLALRTQLSRDRRDSLRFLALRLEQIKPEELNDLRWFRAHQAVLVGAVGEPQDAGILEAWIRDEIRFRAEEDAAWKAKCEAWEAGGRKTQFPGARGITVYWNWYQGGLVQLGCQEAGEVCLRLLNCPELVGEAAWGLVLLAQNNDDETSAAFAHHPQYSQIYERRTARRTKVVSETARPYADAIFNVVQSSFAEIDRAGSKFPMRDLARAISALAGLDDLRAMPFLQRISSDKYSGWILSETLHGLVVRGVVISGKETAQALEPFIAEHEKEPRGGEHDSWYAVVRCLAALLFSDTPSAGTERIRRLPPRRIQSYHVREILRLLGACQAPEAADLLIELAGVPEVHRHCSYELVTALSNNVNAKAQRHLLDLFDRLCSGELPRGHDTVDPLAKAIARAAKLDDTIRASIKARCRDISSPLQHQVLARILQEIGDGDSALMLCDFIHDEFPITYDMERLVEAIATTHVPAGGSCYCVKPREAPHLKKQLLETALKDLNRRASSLELLAVITQCRLEHGFPDNEPIHPDIEAMRQSPVPWELL